ncbi:MAG: DUF4157 domain-containing protein [Chryseobacterium gambrini]|nr:DUF4157 domain-containing protein [Chryseobacterium gambrini]
MEAVNLQREQKQTSKKNNSTFFKPAIQKKLSVGSANDSYEVEADQVADKVMKMSEPSPQTTHTGALLQKKCATCEQEEKLRMKPLAESISPLIQRSSSEIGGVAPSHVENQINSSRGGGSVMDHETKNFMENRFGTDFSDVKIHTGSEAVQMSRELNSQAFAVGNDIYFNEGKYNPTSDSGKHLLAHELTHTIQQSGGVGRKIQKSANTCTYGEIRQWAITSLRDFSAPANLANVKSTIGSVCTQRNCHCVDGSNATEPGDQHAWQNIVNATGGNDLSNNANYMCVGSQNCGFVHQCQPVYQPGERRPAIRERTTNLQPVATLNINGHSLYFYRDTRNGNCPPD